MDIADPSDESLLRASSLAKSLHDVLCCLQEGQSQLTVKINQWTEVSTLVQLDSEETETRKAKTSVRSYSALLLLESLENIMASLPASCNPAMHRLLNTLSPMMNLQDVSLDADVPLSQVLLFSSHLVHWGKAMTIYPLSESNVYIASPTAETRVRSSLDERFSAELPGLSLPQVLSTLELPRQMAELKATYADKTIQMVVWLLRHRQITQLHTYVYIVPSLSSPPTGAISPTSPSNGHNLNTSHHDSHGEHSDEDIEQSLQEEMRRHLSVQEYQCVMHTSAATDYDDLALFVRLCKYFRGNQHLEEIMLKENIQRSQLLTLIDKFSEILVTCTLPEHSKTV
ncbi:GATOR complex protein NPRL3 [Geodia barretti]|uniref:GATOR complex protein NPRL3 n=1 Tax=Geodia barretti TaxID=519541 RepID=A0AA35TF22_GEOBA|nr:GATOR complex protein NPRL3 [Geodia barretti]